MVAIRTPITTHTSGQRTVPEPDLNHETLLEMYRMMVLSRAVDDRAWLLQRQGKAAFVVSGQGHEACQVGSVFALRPGQDHFLPYYRDTAVVLSVGLEPRDILLGVLGRDADPCSGGRQMPSHWSCPELHIYTSASTVATQLPHAAGVALASKLRREDDVTIVYFGDGATSEGDFHEALNFTGIHRLPVIFMCENNRYAISVPQAKQMAVPDIAGRAASYGFTGVQVDGCDPVATYHAVYEAAERARAGGGPTLIEAEVCRLVAHTSNDDERGYRPADELANLPQLDPIPRFRARLMEMGVLTEADDDRMQEQVQHEVAIAAEEAERAPLPTPESALTHVFADQ